MFVSDGFFKAGSAIVNASRKLRIDAGRFSPEANPPAIAVQGVLIFVDPTLEHELLEQMNGTFAPPISDQAVRLTEMSFQLIDDGEPLVIDLLGPPLELIARVLKKRQHGQPALEGTELLSSILTEQTKLSLWDKLGRQFHHPQLRFQAPSELNLNLISLGWHLEENQYVFEREVR